MLALLNILSTIRVYSEVDGMECCLSYKAYNAGFCKILTHPRWYVTRPNAVETIATSICCALWSCCCQFLSERISFFRNALQGERRLSSYYFRIRTTEFYFEFNEAVSCLRRRVMIHCQRSNKIQIGDKYHSAHI